MKLRQIAQADFAGAALRVQQAADFKVINCCALCFLLKDLPEMPHSLGDPSKKALNTNELRR